MLGMYVVWILINTYNYILLEHQWVQKCGPISLVIDWSNIASVYNSKQWCWCVGSIPQTFKQGSVDYIMLQMSFRKEGTSYNKLVNYVVYIDKFANQIE